MLAFLLITSLILCQTAKPHYSPEDYKDLYEVENVELRYQGEFETIRDVDFKNLTIYVFDYGSVSFKAKLKRGKYERLTKSGGHAVRFISVHRLDAHGDQPARAIAKFDHSSGAASTCFSVFIQVFELRGKQLFLTQNIDFGERSTSDTRFDWKRNSLDILAIHPCDDNAWNYRLQIGFRWNGKRFQRVTLREIPSPTN